MNIKNTASCACAFHYPPAARARPSTVRTLLAIVSPAFPTRWAANAVIGALVAISLPCNPVAVPSATPTAARASDVRLPRTLPLAPRVAHQDIDRVWPMHSAAPAGSASVLTLQVTAMKRRLGVASRGRNCPAARTTGVKEAAGVRIAVSDCRRTGKPAPGSPLAAGEAGGLYGE